MRRKQRKGNQKRKGHVPARGGDRHVPDSTPRHVPEMIPTHMSETIPKHASNTANKTLNVPVEEMIPTQIQSHDLMLDLPILTAKHGPGHVSTEHAPADNELKCLNIYTLKN